MTADPAITVADLMAAMEGWLVTQRSRDLTTLLKRSKGVSWKTGPSADNLGVYSDLFVALFKVAQNGVLPSKKLQIALVKMHEQKPCNFSTQQQDLWAMDLGASLRAIASKYRDLYLDPAIKTRCFKKATADEIMKIEVVLKTMHIPEKKIVSKHPEHKSPQLKAATAQEPWVQAAAAAPEPWVQAATAQEPWVQAARAQEPWIQAARAQEPWQAARAQEPHLKAARAAESAQPYREFFESMCPDLSASHQLVSTSPAHHAASILLS